MTEERTGMTDVDDMMMKTGEIAMNGIEGTIRGITDQRLEQQIHLQRLRPDEASKWRSIHC